MNYIGRCGLRILNSELSNKTHVHGLGRMLSYKSAYALENFYPKSNLNLYTPTSAPADSNPQFNGYIPIKEIDITYSNSSGPGGQNVNKVNTKVDLRFHVGRASWLTEELKDKLLEQQRNKINKEGYLIIKSDLTRSQQLNVADALQKLRQMIRELIVVPVEPDELTKEKHRKKQLKAAHERVFVKRIKSQVKEGRQGPSVHDK